jgi:hypothetical protein
MIVDDLCVSDAAFRPSKTDPVLSVDPDTVLALSIPFQYLQVVAGRDPKILDALGVVENEELGSSSPLQVWRTDLPCGLGVFAVEHILGALVTEGQDHVSMIARLVCYHKTGSSQKMRSRGSHDLTLGFRPEENFT